MQSGDRYDSLFQFYGEKRGVPWQLLKAQAYAESSLDPNAISPAGARGLAQFMPATWAEWHAVDCSDPFNPEHSIIAQTGYMQYLLSQFGGTITVALAAYNWGPGNVHKHGASNAPRSTQVYIDRIMAHYSELVET